MTVGGVFLSARGHYQCSKSLLVLDFQFSAPGHSHYSDRRSLSALCPSAQCFDSSDPFPDGTGAAGCNHSEQKAKEIREPLNHARSQAERQVLLLKLSLTAPALECPLSRECSRFSLSSCFTDKQENRNPALTSRSEHDDLVVFRIPRITGVEGKFSTRFPENPQTLEVNENPLLP